MISEQLRKVVRPVSTLLTVIWAAECGSLVVYYLIAWYVSRQEAGASANVPMLPIVFGAIAAMSLLAGIAVKFFAFSQARARQLLGQAPTGPQLAGVDELTEDEQKLARLAAGLQPLYIMSLGMINSCALFGMVLAVIQHDAHLFVPFMVASMVGCVTNFPRVDAYLEEARVGLRHSF